MNKKEKLQTFATSAKKQADKLRQETGAEHWDYSRMTKDFKLIYSALKKAYITNQSLDSIKEFITENLYYSLEKDSSMGKTRNKKYLDILGSLRESLELEDLVIIKVLNLPGENEDYFIGWLDFGSKSYLKENLKNEKINDLDNDQADKVEDFDFCDNFSNMSRDSYWSFKWNEERQTWLLDKTVLDNFTEAYLSISNNISAAEALKEDEVFNYPRLI